MKKIFFTLVFLLAFALQPNLHGLKSGTHQEKKAQAPLQHEVTVALKLVQVYVTDKNGNPVLDLTKDDFILYDNGELQKITDFEKHILQRPEKKAEERLKETALPPSEIPSRMNRKFILLLDIDRNSMASIAKSKKAALHFIQTRVQPTDEVGIFSYSTLSGLVVHEYLTSDHEKAKEAIRRIKEVPGLRPTSPDATEITLERERARAEGEAGLSQPSQPLSFSPSSSGLSSGSSDIVETTKIFIECIKDLAKAVRYVPGYKNILLFSGGVPTPLLYSSDQTLREDYEEMGKELATSNSPVYAINTLGARRVPSLQLLSELSGGSYFHKVENYEKIANQIQNTTSNYYVLGYSIDETWDGKYHEIKVEVRQKGFQVHAQGGYFNAKPFTEFSKFEKQLHLVDLALSKNPYFQEPLYFPVIAFPCSGKKESNFILLSEIAPDELGEVARGKTELVTFIFDKDKNVAYSMRGESDFSQLSPGAVYFYTISSLSPGQYECRVVIRNLETGAAALASTSINIPQAVEDGLRCHPPLLLIPDKKSTYLKLTVEEKKAEEEIALSITDIYPFLSNENSPLLETADRQISKLLAIVPVSISSLAEPEIEVTAYLIQHETGEKIPLPLSILASEHKEETYVLLLEAELPELKPGSYSVEICAADAKSGAKSDSSQTFRVK